MLFHFIVAFHDSRKPRLVVPDSMFSLKRPMDLAFVTLAVLCVTVRRLLKIVTRLETGTMLDCLSLSLRSEVLPDRISGHVRVAFPASTTYGNFDC